MKNAIKKLFIALLLFSTGMLTNYYLAYQGIFSQHDSKLLFGIKDTYIKPRIVYHGSPIKNLSLIKPNQGHMRDENEGAVIFASPDMGFASIFMSQHDDSWTGIGYFGAEEHYYFVCKDKVRFMKEDNGGAIYALPSDGFVSRANIGMRGSEWTNNKPIKPLYKFDFSSTLEAMINLGIQVFFMDESVFEKFSNADYPEQREILASLQSENEKANRNRLNIFPKEK